ncbi:MAG TPA: hypothetical protein VKU80_17530 [Planctomycetota bacterium]|nr:hypothetical protein [Planctomycetota bacterium]
MSDQPISLRKDGPASDDWAVYVGDQVVEELQGLRWSDARFYHAPPPGGATAARMD